MAERLSNTSLTRILVLLRRNFSAFLTLPRYKQMHLAERALAVLVLNTQRYSILVLNTQRHSVLVLNTQQYKHSVLVLTNTRQYRLLVLNTPQYRHLVRWDSGCTGRVRVHNKHNHMKDQ